MPTFDVPYEATRMKDSRYHCIAMMPAYRNYSFEELRLAYPHKRVLKTENVLVASVGNGEKLLLFKLTLFSLLLLMIRLYIRFQQDNFLRFRTQNISKSILI